MNNRRQIQQMRADVDALARQDSPSPLYVVTRPGDGHMKIRLRKLVIGEQRRVGDLWLDSEGQLNPLGLKSWWRRPFGYGRLEVHHSDTYRICY